jgi:very-short-patch-repair endonuclease
MVHAAGEKVAPAVSSGTRYGRGRHAFLAWVGMHHRNDAPSLFTLVTLAREMRKAPTRSEALLWAQLRGRKVGGARFRRQAVVGRFIVDFLAPCERLVVEVDGGVHLAPERRRYDEARRAELERFYGLRFVRVSAELVERDVLAAVARVRAALGR